MIKNNNILYSPIKYAGGKRWLIPKLKSIFEQYKSCRLVEPFAGGLSISLGLKPDRVLANDINPHVMNFFRWVKEGFEPQHTNANTSDFYYLKRDKFNFLIKQNRADTLEAAQLFYYLNKFGYNGLCRFNSKGLYNVPFGKYKKVTLINDFSEYQKVMQNWKFLSLDFQDLYLSTDDFIYADPPYDVEFRQYSKESFSWYDQERLAFWLSSRTLPVVVSNQATDRIVDLYTSLGFDLEYVQAPRRISCNGDRAPAREILAFKNI